MSQELYAVIGEKEVELRSLRAAHEQLKSKFEELQQFVFQAARDGRALTLEPQSQPPVVFETPVVAEQPAVVASETPSIEESSPSVLPMASLSN